MNTQPGPWVLVFDCIEWMKAMSSTWRAIFGSSVLIILPLWPAGANGQGLFIKLPFLPWNVTRFFLARHRLAVVLFELGLMLPQVDVRRAAGAEYLQDAFRFRRELSKSGARFPASDAGV